MNEATMMAPDARYEPGMRIYNQKLGMWVFLASEVMFFTALIGSYIILRNGVDQWALPNQASPLNIPLTAANTFLLICSSVSMVKAFAAIQKGDQAKLKLYLVLTVLMGTLFVSVQAYEYYVLGVVEGFLPTCGAEAAAHIPNCNLFGSTFYTMTGFHGTHVTLGVLCMLFVTWKAFRGKYTQQNHGGVEVIGLYWHFVDLVWIILFTIVYLI